jgi:hypothetical protein
VTAGEHVIDKNQKCCVGCDNTVGYQFFIGMEVDSSTVVHDGATTAAAAAASASADDVTMSVASTVSVMVGSPMESVSDRDTISPARVSDDHDMQSGSCHAFLLCSAIHLCVSCESLILSCCLFCLLLLSLSSVLTYLYAMTGDVLIEFGVGVNTIIPVVLILSFC